MWVQFASIGVIGGLVAGLAGVGGGVVSIPLMMVWAKVDHRKAIGSSTVAICVTAIVAASFYYNKVDYDLELVCAIALPAVVAATLVATIVNKVDGVLLKRIFAAVIFIAAIRMLFGDVAYESDHRFGFDSAIAAPLIGLISGTVSGLMGIGGGVIVVPGSVIFLEMPQLASQGLSLLVMVPTTFSAGLVHIRLRNVLWPAVLPLTLGSVSGGLLGSVVAIGFPERVLAMGFAVIMMYFSQRSLGLDGWVLRKAKHF